MKRDLSVQLYEKYFTLKNRKVEITLINKLVLKGILIGYFKGDTDAGEPLIIKWHLVDEKDEASLEIDIFGSSAGTIVNQNEIAEIRFYEDGSVMKFKEGN